MKVFTIRYKDAKGTVTERDISHVKCVKEDHEEGTPTESGEEVFLIRAYCHLREEPRTFWLSSIESLVEKATGRTIDPECLIDEIENPFFNRIKIKGKLYDPYDLIYEFDPLEQQEQSTKNRQLIKRHLGKMDQDYLLHLIMLLKSYDSPLTKRLVDAIPNPPATPMDGREAGKPIKGTANPPTATEWLTCGTVALVIVIVIIFFIC